MTMTHYKDENNVIYAYDETQTPKEGLIKITDEEAVLIRQQTIDVFLNSLNYAEKRQAEYPPMAEYIDGIVKGDDAQVQEYINKCLAVKAKYPKD